MTATIGYRAPRELAQPDGVAAPAHLAGPDGVAAPAPPPAPQSAASPAARALELLLLGDPAVATWLTRTALAVGDDELAVSVAGIAQALADAHPGHPALAAAAAHSRGLARRDPVLLARAAGQHPDPRARAAAAEDLGVLCGGQGDRDQAIDHLKAALNGYREIGAGFDHARIRQRLRELGIRRRHWSTPPARPVTGWDSLTETEQAVAALVADGLNNKQVGARMYISSHTVAHHLRQAFRKLSIASRVELARDRAGRGRRSGREATEPVLPGLGLGRRVAVVEVVRGREDHVVVAVDQRVHRVVGTHAHEAR